MKIVWTDAVARSLRIPYAPTAARSRCPLIALVEQLPPDSKRALSMSCATALFHAERAKVRTVPGLPVPPLAGRTDKAIELLRSRLRSAPHEAFISAPGIRSGSRRPSHYDAWAPTMHASGLVATTFSAYLRFVNERSTPVIASGHLRAIDSSRTAW